MPPIHASQTAGAEAAADTAQRSGSSHLRFWLSAVGLLWLDLWSKAWVFRNLKPDEVQPAFPGVLEFRRSLNDGAVFGSFSGYSGVFIVASVFALAFVLYLFANSSPRQRVLHVSLAMILAGALGNLYDRAFMAADVVRFREKTSGRMVSVIGKIVDETAESVRIGDWPDGGRPQSFKRAEIEVRRQGVVRDFLRFVLKFPASVPRVGGMDIWPWIFNVADAALVCGVILLLLTSLFERGHREAPTE
jgi:lipoprotein signal peptidase